MTKVELLRADAEYAFARLLETLEGVTEPQAWAVLPPAGEEYLHTDGSVHGLVLHIAGGKRMYGSVGWRGSEQRWRDLAAQVDGFEPDWKAALAYLRESHDYWMSCWAGLTDDELAVMRPIPSGRSMETWRIVEMVNHHDSYHAGQIAVLRYANGESSVPPPSVGDDIRQYCRELPNW